MRGCENERNIDGARVHNFQMRKLCCRIISASQVHSLPITHHSSLLRSSSS